MKYKISQIFKGDIKFNDVSKITLILQDGKLKSYDSDSYEIVGLFSPIYETDEFTVYSDFDAGILNLTPNGELIKYHYWCQTHENPDNPVVEIEVITEE